MDNFSQAAEQISLFCRLHMNTKRELPIRSSEMGMLIYLCKTGGDKTPMDIARFFNVSKAMATNMITAMHKQGYIQKQASADDRRSSLILLTAKAQVLVDSTYEEYYKSMRRLKEKMGDDDFTSLLALLGKANNTLLEVKEHG